MELTLRILAHELEAAFASVDLGQIDGKRAFSDVRLTSRSAADRSLLYVVSADRLSDVEAEKDAFLLIVGPAARASATHAALSVEADCLEVFAFLQDVFGRYRAWLQAMDASIIENQGIQRLFDLSESYLANNVIVVDPALKLLAYTKGIACDDPVTMELIKHGYHTEENIRKFQINKRFDIWAKQNGFIINDSNRICAYTTAVYSFKTIESFSLIVVMMCNNVEPEPWLLDTFIMFLVRVAFYSQRDYATDSPAGSSVKAFMRDMLGETLVNEAEIEERRQHLGIPVHGRFCLFFVDVGEQRPLIARIVSDISRQTVPAKAVVYQDDIVVLCFSCQTHVCNYACETDSCPMHHTTVTGRLNKTLEEYGLHAGRSSGFERLSTMPTALRQAKAALRIGYEKSLWSSIEHGRHRCSRIANFDDGYFEYLVDRGLEEDRNLLSTLHCCRLLRRMWEYDCAHNTDNCRFLYDYLRLERRTTLVAESLHMHRNNVKYRIDRIEEQFGICTDDPHERFELALAFRVLASCQRTSKQPE